jgi:RNA polymerase sigma-70 factor, ECF subfamily
MYTTSATLLERVRQRTDHASWDRFVGLYTPFLYHCGLRLGLSEADAADAVQDVFLILLDKLPTFQYEPGKSFRAWLRTVTVNKCRERFRRRREVAAGGSEQGLDLVPGPTALDDFFDAEHNQHIVAQALKLMQSEFESTTWQACWQTTVEDRPAADVAAELGITTNAVYVARSRVLRHLREELRDLLDE